MTDEMIFCCLVEHDKSHARIFLFLATSTAVLVVLGIVLCLLADTENQALPHR